MSLQLIAIIVAVALVVEANSIIMTPITLLVISTYPTKNACHPFPILKQLSWYNTNL